MDALFAKASLPTFLYTAQMFDAVSLRKCSPPSLLATCAEFDCAVALSVLEILVYTYVHV